MLTWVQGTYTNKDVVRWDIQVVTNNQYIYHEYINGELYQIAVDILYNIIEIIKD